MDLHDFPEMLPARLHYLHVLGCNLLELLPAHRRSFMSSGASQTRSFSSRRREWRRRLKSWSLELWLMKQEQNWISRREPRRFGK